MRVIFFIVFRFAFAAEVTLPGNNSTQNFLKASVSANEMALQNEIKAALDSWQTKGIKTVNLGNLLLLLNFHGEIEYLKQKPGSFTQERQKLNTLLLGQKLSEAFLMESLNPIDVYLSGRADPRISSVYWTSLTQIPNLLSNSNAMNIRIWNDLIFAWANQGKYNEAKLVGESWIKSIDSNEELKTEAFAKMTYLSLLFDNLNEFEFWHKKLKATQISNSDSRKRLSEAHYQLHLNKPSECIKTLSTTFGPNVMLDRVNLALQLFLAECYIKNKDLKEANNVMYKLKKLVTPDFPKVKSKPFRRRYNGGMSRNYILLGNAKEAYTKCIKYENLVTPEEAYTYLRAVAVCKALAPKNEALPKEMIVRLNKNLPKIKTYSSGSEFLRVLVEYLEVPSDSASMTTVQAKVKKTFGEHSVISWAIALPK